MERTDLRRRLHLSGMGEDSRELALRHGLGYELTAFCYAPELDRPDAFSRAAALTDGFDRLWLHAPFAELSPCAIDPLVREIAAKRFAQAVSMAERLGIRRIVFHAGFVPAVYFPEWFTEQSVLFWKEFLKTVPADMTVALENVMEPSPELLAGVLRQVGDPRLCACLDLGHANSEVSRTPPEEWIEPLLPWLRHVHLHSNDGGWDTHAPLGTGTVPMARLLDTLLERCPEATFTIENQRCAPSVAWLAAEGYL